MAIQLSDVSNALQKVIMPFIQDNLPKQTILLDQIKRNQGVTFMNDNFYAPIRTSRHGGVVNLANDSSSLLTGKSSIGQASVGVKILTGTFDITKLAMDATKTSKGAVENQLVFQAKSLATDFSRSINRQYYSDGVGVVSEVAGSSSSTVFTVQAPSASLDDGRSVFYGSVNGDIVPTKYLVAGQIIGIGTAAANVGTISSIDPAIGGGTVTLTGATTSAANDAIYILDGSGAGAGTSEIQGIRAALSTSTGTSTYAGVARSTVGWTPQLGTASETLTLSAIEQVYLSAREYSQMGDRYAIFMNKTLYKKYGDLLTALRRTVNSTELLGGWTGLEFAAGAGNVGVFLDYDVPDGEVLVINLDSWTVCQVSDMNWLEDPSSALTRRPDKISYQATMAWFTNLICLAPAANGRLVQKKG
jgi:hypothetical protein